MDDLGDGVEKDDAGSEEASGGDHGNRVDDGDGIEKGLEKNFPDGTDVAIFDIDRAKKQGDAESKKIEFEEKNRDEEPTPRGGDAVDESENDDDDEIDANVDDGGEGSGNGDDVFGETDFADEIAADDDGVDALIGAFGEETPENGTEKEVDGIVWDVVAEAKELGENDVKNGEKEQRAEKRPKITENRALIAEFEVGFGEFLQENAVAFVPELGDFHSTIIPYLIGISEGTCLQEMSFHWQAARIYIFANKSNRDTSSIPIKYGIVII